ncbi:hypothetical protein DRO66_04045 [Candidatus Bathyarchaeota archaeon]|jgi:uncharacterized protein YecE (DUF72 family)|nr:MAG: hypothetical protein DRO66_04045 [Candidatus Bathyarchaeota archaeon]
MLKSATLIFGTSGWSYKEWVGPFYDKVSKMFSHYKRFFNTAEINSTFYVYPSRSIIYGLNRTAPKDFIFSAKLPRLITHQKRLDPNLKVEKHLLRFLELLNPLKMQGKLGCILIQLPPSFVYEHDIENFEAFLELIPEGYDFVAEFRDHSWMREDTWRLLKKYNVAYCIVDEPLLPPEVHLTADFAYFRWHGRGTRPWYDYHYSEEELEEWVPRVEGARDRVDRIYGYFNNHYHGYAVENCIEILEMLNASKPEHCTIKERIIRYNILKKPIMREMKLEEFGFDYSEQGVEELLYKLTDKGRLVRGIKIKDEELIIEESSKERVRAKIRKYTIELDIQERTLKHNCDDWRRGLGMKRICKHVVKLFMMVPKEESREVLKDIIKNRDIWGFQLR